MIASVAARLGPAGRLVAVAAVAGGALLAGASPGPLGPAAARGALVVAALGGAAALVRRRGSRPAQRPALAVVARAPLGKDTGLALVAVGDRQVLVGYGSGGVSLLEAGAAAPAREVAP
jgi:flagellar protein FliO/FliZ